MSIYATPDREQEVTVRVGASRGRGLGVYFGDENTWIARAEIDLHDARELYQALFNYIVAAECSAAVYDSDAHRERAAQWQAEFDEKYGKWEWVKPEQDKQLAADMDEFIAKESGK